MSRKDKTYRTIMDDLTKDGFEVRAEYRSEAGTIDMLAIKENFVFAIEVKERPLETFDIIRTSAISTSLARMLDFKGRKVMGVITGSNITPETKSFGEKTGVIVEEPRKVSETIEASTRAWQQRVERS